MGILNSLIAMMQKRKDDQGSNVDKFSFLLITLDSCRYDTYIRSNIPNFNSIGEAHRAFAPGNFTLPSHMSIFAGFTPGDPHSNQPYINPKRKRLWKLGDDVQHDTNGHLLVLPGENIVDGFNNLGYMTIGTGGVGWFDPTRVASKVLIDRFMHYKYFGDYFYLEEQLEWLKTEIVNYKDSKKFIFLNIGETHGPYWHKGATWDSHPHPCLPFGANNDRALCEVRQKHCLEYVDSTFGDFLPLVKDFNIIICSDHGDAWGEDGLWEHSIHHEKVYEVPLVMKINDIESM